MRQITRLIGDPVGSQGPVSSFGWRDLGRYSSCKEAEDRVAESLISDFGVYVTRAGERSQSHDLEVSGIARRSSRTAPILLGPGLYEVKTLWRRNENSSFDRRFKVGVRGEMIYGRRDSQIKSFALALEGSLDGMIDAALSDTTRNSTREFIDQAHEFIDQAMMRRHSKRFEERLVRIAKASLVVPSLTLHAHAVLNGGIGLEDIRKGFHDIEGIFIVAGKLYTLVTKAEMGTFLAFDSSSSEGPKLRIHGVIPSETGKQQGKKKERIKK